ncbi:MAG: DegQ family serine endoprotease [Inquilinaceae bacterium]
MRPSLFKMADAGGSPRSAGPAWPRRRLAAAGLALTFLFGGTASLAAPVPDSFADLAEQVSPAVVNISTTIAPQTTSDTGPRLRQPNGEPNDQMEEFFRRFFEGRPGQQFERPRRGPGQAQGSGFIIDPAGYVVTNDHVVGRATDITVTLTDGTEFPAELVGSDPRTDLALLKVEADRDLPFVAFAADQGKARVGDWVMAVGNPFGLGGTVTVGIVSAQSRDLQAGPFDDFLQVDAAINQGNSGGPLFDMDGNVVGVNSAIVSPNGGSVGLGFAIPATLAQPVIAQLRETGTVVRGWLGVNIQTVTPDLADALGLDSATGALVSNVMPGSPAQRAGLRQGDVILSFGGAEVETMRDLPRLVADTPVGDRIDLEVLRGGDRLTLDAVIERLEDEQVASAPVPDQGTGTLGLELASLTAEQRQSLGLSDDIQGALVTDVAPDSPAAEAGLRPGDLIVEAASQPVVSPAEMVERVERAKETDQRALLLLVNRQGDTLFVAVNLQDA